MHILGKKGKLLRRLLTDCENAYLQDDQLAWPDQRLQLLGQCLAKTSQRSDRFYERTVSRLCTAIVKAQGQTQVTNAAQLVGKVQQVGLKRSQGRINH